MPKTIPTPGLVWSPELALAALNPKFNDGGNDGDNDRLTDNALSNTPGQIKQRFNALEQALLVTATGVTTEIKIEAGILAGDDGLPLTIAATTRVLPPNQTRVVWVTPAGVVDVGATPPVRSYRLATVTTSANAVTTILDQRALRQLLPAPRLISVFGGGVTQDVVMSANTTVTRAIRCRNFNLNAGVTLTNLSGQVEIIASGDVVIDGVITVPATVSGAAGFAGSCLIQHYVIEAGKGPGGGFGTNAPGAPVYSWEVSPMGSGGASGFVIAGGLGSVIQSRGGNGGGSIVIRAAGSITISGQLIARGGNAVIGSATGATGDYVISGGGGGSGGSVGLYAGGAITATAAASFDVRGGDGASGFVLRTGNAAGGGGGGGGWVVARSAANNFTGATLLLAGGNAGATFPSGSGAAGGSGGTFAGAGGASGAIGQNGAIGQAFFDNITPV